jgi:hypothetical protein
MRLKTNPKYSLHKSRHAPKQKRSPMASCCASTELIQDVPITRSFIPLGSPSPPPVAFEGIYAFVDTTILPARLSKPRGRVVAVATTAGTTISSDPSVVLAGIASLAGSVCVEWAHETPASIEELYRTVGSLAMDVAATAVRTADTRWLGVLAAIGTLASDISRVTFTWNKTDAVADFMLLASSLYALEGFFPYSVGFRSYSPYSDPMNLFHLWCPQWKWEGQRTMTVPVEEDPALTRMRSRTAFFCTSIAEEQCVPDDVSLRVQHLVDYGVVKALSASC